MIAGVLGQSHPAPRQRNFSRTALSQLNGPAFLVIGDDELQRYHFNSFVKCIVGENKLNPFEEREGSMGLSGCWGGHILLPVTEFRRNHPATGE